MVDGGAEWRETRVEMPRRLPYVRGVFVWRRGGGGISARPLFFEGFGLNSGSDSKFLLVLS
jgi:hypothetical protein